MEKLTVGLVSLGCDKNRLDAEIALSKLNGEFKLVGNPKDADIIIVNTCGFIESAKQESINTILEMARYKEKSQCKLLVVTGCLSARYGKELMELLPEIDVMLGVNNYDKLIESIENFFKDKNKICNTEYSDININEGERILTTPKHSAYLRISEGCDNFCTYCIIPKIRGKYRSRSIESIIKEAQKLVDSGVKEIILVGQDTTKYGIDIYGEKRLHILINELSKIENLKWIRLLYCYPEEITLELIKEIKENPKVCKYVDMPIQHISDNILKRMGRRGRKKGIIDTINILRKEVPSVALRTSLIVGFPGETEEDFNCLLDFIKDTKFENLGVFKYSQEEGTSAAIMKDQISEEIKQKREEEAMILQQSISLKNNKDKVGKDFDVLVEGFNGEYWFGRNYEMAPEIDGSVFFKSKDTMYLGDIVSVKITNCLEYDLIGVVNDEFSK